MNSLVGTNFLTLKDLTPQQIEYLVDLSADLRIKRKRALHTNIARAKM